MEKEIENLDSVFEIFSKDEHRERTRELLNRRIETLLERLERIADDNDTVQNTMTLPASNGDWSPGTCERGAPSSGANESPISIDEAAVAELIALFRLLDKWDREANHDAEIM